MPFSAQQIAYLRQQGYGRLATVGVSGEPHNVPVSFEVDAERGTIEITGRGMGESRKFRNVRADGRVSFVVDDIPSRDPEVVRAVVIHGIAEALDTGGRERRPHCADEMIRIHPRRVIAWGIEEQK
ncbi:PPOX class F420-dependent oxidoreductase [Streptomyces sp. NPDC050617]|uniref:PPOX class F420-dependent oxidoreductase n=1 Tax=Streptomyces sp. NPDC050617 TaxID=3154628 RepID=UPI0034377959